MNRARYLPVALALGLSVWLAQPAQAREAVRGCAAKQQAIERELNYARESGNTHRVRGLERARDNARHCDDGQLQRERERDVDRARSKVQERERELAEKQAKGKSRDIAKAQRKLDEARHDLQRAQVEIHR